MREYLKKGLAAGVLVFAMLLTVCMNDTLHAATKVIDRLEAEYIGDDLDVGDEVRKADFVVRVYYEDEDDEDYDVLGTREFDLVLRRAGSTTMEYTEDQAVISYGNKWCRVDLATVGNGGEEESRTLLSISAKYEGDPVSVGGMASKSDITVKATYRVYYTDGDAGRVTEELSGGWILLAHTITSGDNDLTITYTEDGVKKTCTVVVPSTGTDGNWVRDGDAWRYRYDDATYLIGDWLRSGGKWYYMDEYGYMMNRCKAVIDGDTYYFDDAGVMQTGWVYLGRDWYFFGRDGVMETGWVFTGGNWYYLDKEGIMLTDWVFLNGKWYFLDTDGKMLTGWLHRSYTWFFLDGDGSMRTGWVYSGGKWYFMDHGGAMLTNTWVGNHYVDGFGVWTATR